MKIIKLSLLALACGLFVASCDVDAKGNLELPEFDVDIDAKEGSLPDFDVEWADVNVGTRTETVTVPKVVVVTEEVEIEVPYIDVDMPGDDDNEELTLQVEAEVSGKMHELKIQEVYATGNKLYVVSKLTETSQDLGDERVRISDRLVLNAGDLDVKHYIVGKRPAGSFNTSYTYVPSRSALDKKLTGGKTIYKR